MSDLINRQAAIDALWKALYEYEDKTEKQFLESEELDIATWFLHRIFVQNMSDIDRQTILNLPSAQPEPRWIPVTERLPEKGSFALVTDFGDVEKAYYDSDGHWWQVWGDRLKNVTAWMPLPEPYREEETNDKD